MVVPPRPFDPRPGPKLPGPQDGGERKSTRRLPCCGSGGEAGVPGSPRGSPPPPPGGGRGVGLGGAVPAACFPRAGRAFLTS